MPNIQGGGGYIPQPIQPQRAAAPQVQQQVQQQAQTELAPRDVFKTTQTSQGSQLAQRLTSDNTKAQIHNLIQTAQIQVPQEKPQLQMMQRPAMGSALADALGRHHVPDQQSSQAQQTQQQMNNPGANPGLNQQVQQNAGQLMTSTFVRQREHTEDSASRNSLQSGKRVRKQEKEGEFDSLEDFGGGDSMSGNNSGRDQRSDSQKKKQILTQEEKRKPPQGAKPALSAQPKTTSVGPSHFKPAAGPLNSARPGSGTQSATPKPPAPKPPIAKPSVQRVQPPLGQQKPVAPPKKPTDEWTI